MNRYQLLPLSILASAFIGLPSLNAAMHPANQFWPEWRGPTGNGVAPQADPPVEWSESSNVKWKVAIPGKGHSSPVVWGGKLFIMTAVPLESESVEAEPEPEPDDGDRRGRGRGRGGFGRGGAPDNEYEFKLICLDRNSGDVIWERTASREKPHEGHHPTNTYASGSPITDGEHVYAYFSSFGLFCYDLDGELVWQKDFGAMQTRNGFGEGTSPALEDGVLVVLWDTEADSWIAGLDKTTGEQIWKQQRDERTGWATPLVVEHDGSKQVVVNGTNAVRSYDLKSGEFLWECGGQTANAIPSVVSEDGILYAMSGFRGNAAYAIELGHQGNLENSPAVKWTLNRGTPYVPSPLLYQGNLYFLKGNDAFLTVVDAKTGEHHIEEERLNAIRGVYSSPVGADGRVYISGQNGVVMVIEAGNSLNILATNELDEPINATPAIVGNQIFIRGSDHLYCISE